MNIEIESLGSSLRNFEELRDELIVAGKKFDAEALSHLPYDKLVLCATGIAGSAMCPLALVREEKQGRRERFLSMNEEELRDAYVLLQIEQMGGDVMRVRLRSNAPKWETLHPRQQVWFKLNCICNHLDSVGNRMQEVQILLQKALQTQDLPADFVAQQLRKLTVLMQMYPTRLPDVAFRYKIAEIAAEVKKIIPAEEQKVCEAEILFNYQCTSDCYRPLV
jgi:hypothetical protein